VFQIPIISMYPVPVLKMMNLSMQQQEVLFP